MIYYFIINNILLHQSNALDAQDDVFRLIKRELLKEESIQIDKKSAALYIERCRFIYKKGTALYIRKVLLYILIRCTTSANVHGELIKKE